MGNCTTSSNEPPRCYGAPNSSDVSFSATGFLAKVSRRALPRPHALRARFSTTSMTPRLVSTEQQVAAIWVRLLGPRHQHTIFFFCGWGAGVRRCPTSLAGALQAHTPHGDIPNDLKMYTT